VKFYLRFERLPDAKEKGGMLRWFRRGISPSQDKPSANLKPLLLESHVAGRVILFAAAVGLCSASCLPRRYAGTRFNISDPIPGRAIHEISW